MVVRTDAVKKIEPSMQDVAGAWSVPKRAFGRTEVGKSGMRFVWVGVEVQW